MNKLLKRTGVIFLIISVATFIAGLVSCVGTLMAIINLYVDYNSFYITDIINWFIKVALFVVLLVFAILTLKKIFNSQEVDDNKLVRLNYLFSGLFLTVYAFNWILSMIEYSVLLGKFVETSTSVVSFVAAICGATFFALVYFKKYDENKNKVFVSLGYLFFFIYLVIASVGVITYSIPQCFFLYFYLFSGLIHVLTYNKDFSSCLLCKKVKENEKEEKETEENKENNEVSPNEE